MSTRSVGRSAAATLAARFTAVVVLPTPPFWFTTAMTRGRELCAVAWTPDREWTAVRVMRRASCICQGALPQRWRRRGLLLKDERTRCSLVFWSPVEHVV